MVTLHAGHLLSLQRCLLTASAILLLMFSLLLVDLEEPPITLNMNPLPDLDTKKGRKRSKKNFKKAQNKKEERERCLL